ncbi:MAG TPA: hypothetical protein VFU79_02645 [Nitrososphaeraceae archaeon]|nr:hypothetical protein [Nitrososphaeraceae archaeon]
MTKPNYLSSLSFIIIGILLYITSNVYQSVSAQDVKEEESSNDIFSDLSRNLPSVDEDIPNNEQPLESEGQLFENPNTGELEENNEFSDGENMGDSNEQGSTSETIEKSFTNGFSDSGQEPDVLNGDDDGSSNPETSSSSRNEVINDDTNNNNNNIINPSD